VDQAPSSKTTTAQGKNEDLWIVIAAKNEERAIGQVLDEVTPTYPNVVVVDDGSTDATGPIANEHGAIVLRHVINRGQGAALQTGIDYALIRGAPSIATFDADGQHSVGDLAVMLARIAETGADVALGSRFLGSAPGMSTQRRLLLKAAVLVQVLTTGVRLTDAHNGLRVFSRAAVQRIRLEQDRMAHASEIIRQIGELDLKFVETPCTIRYTAYSVQKGQKLSGSLNILMDLAIKGLHG
jgi:glycosyltransferase involved in cell wall biosynthesis